MKVTCSYSGVEFSIAEFHCLPATPAGTHIHPVFSLDNKAIETLYTAYLNGQLSDTESYLLLITLLDRTSLMLYRHPIAPGNHYPQLTALYIERLYSISIRLQAIHHPDFMAPKVIISEENCDLINIKEWLIIWEKAYQDFRDGQAESAYRDSLQKKENALAKFIKSPQIPPEKYAHVLADWACLAANFPPEYAEYWKELIVSCYDFGKIISTQQIHLEDLIEYCEENIDEYSCGSIFSNALFNCLQEGLSSLNDFYSVGFSVLDSSQSEQDTLIKIISNAPDKEPIKTDYPSSFAYLKAKMAWDSALKHAEQARNNEGEL